MNKDFFQGSVLAYCNGRLLIRRGFGYASFDRVGNTLISEANTPDTKFRIASLSKTFTAVAMMLLQERGELDLDDTFVSHVAGFPASYNSITLRQMLTHIAGFADTEAIPNYNTEFGVPRSLEYIADLIKAMPLAYTPGTAYSYVNSDYVLLSLVIEAVSGKSFERFMIDEIFTPLKMTNTGVCGDGGDIVGAASGHVISNGVLTQIGAHHPRNLYGAACFYSTVDDLFKFGRSLFSGSLISLTGFEEMLADNPYSLYGLGWVLDFNYRGTTLCWHYGSILGFKTAMMLFPENDIFIACLGNGTPYLSADMTVTLADWMFGDETLPGYL